MLYIVDQYGNKITLDPTFRIVGLPLKREYSTTKIPGSDGEKPTSEPVVSSANRSITGLLYAASAEEAENKRRELADFCGRGLIKVGYEGEGWHIEGETISIGHKFREDAGRFIAHVSITLKCDDPHQKADEIVEELIITPADYPERIDMSNPHPAANVKLGTYDTSSGAKISDENSWLATKGVPGYTGDGYLSSQEVGNGFSFISFSDFSLAMYQATVSRKMTIFAGEELIKEVDLAGESGFVPVEVNFGTRKAREITVVHTEGFMSVDCIIPTPANLPVVTNLGTVEDYPVLEVEPADTEALCSPLGKKAGDADHPFSMNHIYSSDPLASITPDSTGITPQQTYYDKMMFNNGVPFGISRVAAGQFSCLRYKFDLKALYASMTVDEIKNNMQSILSELWGYSKGAIEVGDPSFESGVNGFGTNTVTISQSTEWAKTGAKSLKIVSSGSSQWAYAFKNYGNQAGKKVEAKFSIFNPVTGGTLNSIHVKWYDVTNDANLATEYIDLALGAEGTYELEAVVPSNCDSVGLYIYPSVGIAEPATIYIDDVTPTAHGLEMYVYNGADWALAAQTAADYPWKVDWRITSGFGIQDEGKICFLIKAKYPSDGISPSAVYLDHCRLDTVMNYAKLGAEAITNYGGNLLENGWGEYFASNGYGQICSFTQDVFKHNGEKLVYPGQKICLSYEGWRDAEAVKNNIFPMILDLSWLKDGTYVFYALPSSIFAEIDANIWVRKTATINLKDGDIGTIKFNFYRNPNTTLPGTVGIRNAVLVAGDKIIKLQPQDLRLLEFSEDVVLSKGDIITADTKSREIIKNDVSLYQFINQSFKFFPLQIFGGLNHFKINHTGANLKIRLKYQPKWR